MSTLPRWKPAILQVVILHYLDEAMAGTASRGRGPRHEYISTEPWPSASRCIHSLPIGAKSATGWPPHGVASRTGTGRRLGHRPLAVHPGTRDNTQLSTSYFLVLLGTWKVLGAVALLVPRRALLKEWACASAFFYLRRAIVSHLTEGHDLERGGASPAIMTLLIHVSWTTKDPRS